jgi:hypothetical protein
MRPIILLAFASYACAHPAITEWFGWAKTHPKQDVAYTPALENEDTPLIVPPHSFQPPQASDARSPCPYLNACANHGILPRDGRNIPIEYIYRLVRKSGFDHVGAAGRVRATRATIKYLLNKGIEHSNSTINLDDYNVHSPVEHDCSLTRLNTRVPQQPGDNRADRALIQQFFALAESTAASPEKQLGLEHVAKWRHQRYKDEVKYFEDNSKTDPTVRKVSFGFKAQVLASSECNNLLHVLGRDGVISLAYAQSFLVDERFPEGWQAPPHNSLNIAKVNFHMAECAAAVWAPEGLLSWVEKKKQTSKFPYIDAFKSVFWE